MRKITAALVGAGQRGMDTYGLYALQHPDELQFTAAADPDRERREEFMRLHAVSEESMFSDWEELLREDRLADLLLICTQDNMHFLYEILLYAKEWPENASKSSIPDQHFA